MVNTGKEYELFVGKLQQALLDADYITSPNAITVEINKKIMDNCGINRQFDIYWEYELGGLTYKTVIECKDYNSNISVEKIDALIGKIRDIPDLKAVFATKKGYQTGAKTKADINKIDLLIVREQNDSDWTSPDGTPLIKKVCIDIHICMPAKIHKFTPILDDEWIKNNTDIDLNNPLSVSERSDEIYIHDLKQDEQYSLKQLSSNLAPLNQASYGLFTEKKTFSDAFISFSNFKLKLIGYEVEYSVYAPVVEPIEIDFSTELVGVVEYLQKGIKKSVFKDGIVR